MWKFTLCLFLQLCLQFCLAQTDSTWQLSDSLQIMTVSYSQSDAETDPDQADADVSPLLIASRDLFAQYSSFQFSTVRFRLRGLTAGYHTVGINGLCLNNPDNGQADMSAWSGLNDVIRFPETSVGISSNRWYASGIASDASFESHAALFKKGIRVAYSVSNRNYNKRLNAAVYSGLTKKNTAFVFAVSGRSGKDSYIPGTYSQALAVYASFEKLFSASHRLSLTALFAPQSSARAASSTAEAKQLSNQPYYNPAWGYQNGLARSANVYEMRQPLLILQDEKITASGIKIQSSLMCKTGTKSSTAINWFDAANPTPDYYRYLPSYYDLQHQFETAENMRENWENNFSTQQLNWDELIRVNRNNLYSVTPNQINTTERRSHYILEKRCESLLQTAIQIHLSKRLNRHFMAGSARVDFMSTQYFKILDDLLGGDFWIDIDQFAENSDNAALAQLNNIDQPNRKVRTGERFGYDYRLTNQLASVFFADNFSGKKVDAFAAFSASLQRTQRLGFLANGKFPENSKGKSEWLSSPFASFRTGIDYKINGRNFFSARLYAENGRTDTRILFISASDRNQIAPDLAPNNLISAECNYHWRFANTKGRIGTYYTLLNNDKQLKTYWSDTYNTMVNSLVHQLSQQLYGIEFGAEWTIKTTQVLQLVTSLNSFRYKNNAQRTVWNASNAGLLIDNEPLLLKGLGTAVGPEFVTGVGYRYNAKKYWYVSLSANYADRRYISANPERRAARYLTIYTTEELEQLNQVWQLQTLSRVYYLNLMAGKSYRLKKRYMINMSLSVNNLLNNTGIIPFAREAQRYDNAFPEKFQPKFTYAQGFNLAFLAGCSF